MKQQPITYVVAIALCAVLSFSSPVWAADTPELVNYQGVLRDSSGEPLTGFYGMVFSFFGSPTLGSNIYREEHLLLGTGRVQVTDGLFTVALGSGDIYDGVTPGVYTNLKDVFADHTDLWLQIEIDTGVDFEELSPRIKVEAAPYALNAQMAQDAENAINAVNAQTAVSAQTAVTADSAQDATTLQGSSPSSFIAAAGDVMTGNLTPSATGLDLGGTSNRWSLFGFDADFSGTVAIRNQLLNPVGNEVLINDDLKVNGGRVTSDASLDFSKYCLTSDTTLCIGMVGGVTYGGLNGQAMSFTMNQDNNRGFIWRDSNDGFGLGAMSLTTDGHLTVAQRVDAPIYYDGQNTAYYLDPGNSNVSARFAGDIDVGYFGTTDDDFVYFDQRAEHFKWDDATTRFEASDTLQITSNLVAGTTSNVAYNTFGGNAPASGVVTNSLDLNVSSDLEVGGGAYFSGFAYMEGNPSSTEKDQSLYFYDGGSRTGNYLRWDDSNPGTCALLNSNLSGGVFLSNIKSA